MKEVLVRRRTDNSEVLDMLDSFRELGEQQRERKSILQASKGKMQTLSRQKFVEGVMVLHHRPIKARIDRRLPGYGLGLYIVHRIFFRKPECRAEVDKTRHQTWLCATPDLGIGARRRSAEEISRLNLGGR